MTLIAISTSVSAKYVLNDEFLAITIDIDTTKPRIEILEILNSNKDYPEYANNIHTIEMKIKIIEKNITEINLDNRYIAIFVNNQNIQNPKIAVQEIKSTDNEKIYSIKMSQLEGNGVLSVRLKEGIVVDRASNKNEEIVVNTKINIDNIAPTGEWNEKKISDGKVTGTINLSEPIRRLDGWNLLEDEKKITKEFTNNISYELPIMDYAGNTGIVNVNVEQASYIKIVYASHNSEVGWTYGYGNYDVAGKQAIIRNDKLKIEAIAFHTEGNMENDFVQASAYIHTYWGDGTYAKYKESGILYRHGYNPNNGEYKSMNTSDNVIIQGKKYFQLGGTGVNMYGRTDINGNNPIPYKEANEYSFGVSGIIMKLKDYSQFAIIYQVYQSQVGWVSAKSDGEECFYKKNMPISAFRIALVPKTEKQYVLDMWNKDVGTKNLNY